MQRLVSPGTLILAIFAVLFGLVGAYAAKKYLQGQGAQAAAPEQKKEPTYNVPVAVMDLPANRTITQGDLMVLSLTSRQIAQAKLPGSWMEKTSQIIGRTLREPLQQGRPFEPTVFYPMGIGPSVAERLQPGERAVSVPFEGTAAQASLITPGAMVDVLFRASPDQKGRIPDATVTLLDRVRVLAVGQSIQEGAAAGSAGTVTLAVNQLQARALKVVEGRGSLMLALRNAADDQPTQKAAPTTLPELLGFQEPEKPFSTQIYRRGHLTTITFEDGQPHVVVADPPYGLPVVGQPQVPSALAEQTAFSQRSGGPAAAEPSLPKASGQANSPGAAQARKSRLPSGRSL